VAWLRKQRATREPPSNLIRRDHCQAQEVARALNSTPDIGYPEERAAKVELLHTTQSYAKCHRTTALCRFTGNSSCSITTGEISITSGEMFLGYTGWAAWSDFGMVHMNGKGLYSHYTTILCILVCIWMFEQSFFG